MARFVDFVIPTLLCAATVTLGACVETGDAGDDAADATGGDDGPGDGGNDDGPNDGQADDGQNDDGQADDGQADDGPASDGGDAPSATAIEGCRGRCDDLLFYDCLDADSHETCWAICPERSADAIEQFDACVSNTLPLCEGCWENLLDADPPPTTDDGDVGTPTCVDACEEWLGAGCPAFGEFESCAGFCASIPESAHDIVVECVAGRDGCTLPGECMFDDSSTKGGG